MIINHQHAVKEKIIFLMNNIFKFLSSSLLFIFTSWPPFSFNQFDIKLRSQLNWNGWKMPQSASRICYLYIHNKYWCSIFQKKLEWMRSKTIYHFSWNFSMYNSVIEVHCLAANKEEKKMHIHPHMPTKRDVIFVKYLPKSMLSLSKRNLSKWFGYKWMGQ